MAENNTQKKTSRWTSLEIGLLTIVSLLFVVVLALIILFVTHSSSSSNNSGGYTLSTDVDLLQLLPGILQSLTRGDEFQSNFPGGFTGLGMAYIPKKNQILPNSGKFAAFLWFPCLFVAFSMFLSCMENISLYDAWVGDVRTQEGGKVRVTHRQHGLIICTHTQGCKGSKV